MRIAILLLASIVFWGPTPAYAFPFGLLGKAGKLAGKAAKASKATKAARVGKKTGAAAAGGVATDVATKGDNVARFGDDVARATDDVAKVDDIAKVGDDAARKSDDGSLLDHAQDAADLADLAPDGADSDEPTTKPAEIREKPKKEASTTSIIIGLAIMAAMGFVTLLVMVRMSRFVLKVLKK